MPQYTASMALCKRGGLCVFGALVLVLCSCSWGWAEVSFPWEGALPSTTLDTKQGSDKVITVNGGDSGSTNFSLITIGRANNTNPAAKTNEFSDNTFTLNAVTSGAQFYVMQFANGNITTACPEINAVVKNNIFNIDGGSFNILRLIQAQASNTDNIISDNTAYFYNVNVGDTLLVFDGGTGSANIENNSVEVSGGTFKQFIANNVAGTSTKPASISGNTLVITDGKFTGLTSPAKVGYGTATNNVLDISGGTFTADIAGAVVGGGGALDPKSYAKNNTVRISGTANVDDAKIFGAGYTATVTSSSRLDTNKVEKKYLTGNRLILDHWRGTAKNIYNLEYIDIYANNDVTNGTVILELTDTTGTTLGSSESKDPMSTTVNLAGIDPGATLHVDDRIHLLRNQSSIDGILANNQEVKQGVSIIYDGKIEKTTNTVDFVITGAKASEESTVMPDGYLPGVELINAGSELMLRGLLFDGNNGLDKENLLGKHVFGISSGGRMHYQTDGDTSFSIDSAHIITGANYTGTVWDDMLQAGVFFEAGWGDAKTETDVSYGTLDGRGNLHYYGVGLMARYEAWAGSLKGLYADASARTGILHNSYANEDVQLNNKSVSYATNTGYVALHGGMGYIHPLNDAWTLDVSARYFWTRVEGSEMTVLGDTYNLDTLNSNRIRASAKLSYTANEELHPFIKLGYNYEFDATSGGTVQDVDLKRNSLRGGTGIGELGFSYSPEKCKDFTLDASVSLYEGQQKGFMGKCALFMPFR